VAEAHTRSHLHGRASGGALAQAFALTAVVLAVEVAGGLLSHSLALLADAGHILTDVVALGLAWFAVRQAARPADERRTYGYQRAGILSALVNGALLVLVVFAVLYEAVRRLAQAEPVDGRIVIATAAVAVVVNLFIAVKLHGEGGHGDLNVRAALLHVLGDLAASAGVILAGIVILLTGWLPIDPLVSIGISLLIAWSGVRLVAETTNILLEGTPAGLDMAQLRAQMESTSGVGGVHDLHVWALSGTERALSAHVVAADPELSGEDAEHLVRRLEQVLCDRFDLGHTTIQVEVCHPCADDPHGAGAGAHNHPHPVRG
jgi:cobalt-zinc-cadmium efflux system protein